jgi:hypothetical protein
MMLDSIGFHFLCKVGHNLVATFRVLSGHFSNVCRPNLNAMSHYRASKFLICFFVMIMILELISEMFLFVVIMLLK